MSESKARKAGAKETAVKTPEEMSNRLSKFGHIVTSWDDIGAAELPNGVRTSMYRVGLHTDDDAPTVFKVYFPPHCEVETHTHACDYTEIVLQGSQKVGNKWLYPGDIRVGMAHKGYGPLVAGPEGATILFVFATHEWPALPLGSDGSSLHVDKIAENFEPAE